MQRYDQYKDSGIDWLGEVPKHWKISKVFYWFYAEKGKNAARLNKDYCGKIEGEFPVYSGQTENNGIMSYINQYEFDYRDKIVLFSTTVGAKAMSVRKLNNRFSLSQNCMIIVNRDEAMILSNYYYYLFDLSFSHYRVLIPDHMQASFRMEDLYQYPISVPSLLEQKAIANFLDDKCEKIDAAVGLKEQQIEKLKELRQITIHNAVTNGVPRHAESDESLIPLKDSGIDWIGEIPEHWEVKPLRYLGTTQNGLSKGGEFFGHGTPFVSYSDVYKNEEIPSSVNGLVKIEYEEMQQYSVLEGDVFFTRTSETIEEIGVSSVATFNYNKASFAGFLIRFRPTKDTLTPLFSKYYFRSQTHRSYFVGNMNLVIRASLSQELLKGLPVLLPPLSEQQAIVTYLEEQTSKIDKAIEQKQQQIIKLKEYKQSLINEVVTGKVKVTA